MILEMKRYLDEPIDEAREWFQSIDDYPHLHHVKCHDDSNDIDDTEKQDHPLPCEMVLARASLETLVALHMGTFPVQVPNLIVV